MTRSERARHSCGVAVAVNATLPLHLSSYWTGRQKGSRMALPIVLTNLDFVERFPQESALGAFCRITTGSNSTLLTSKIGNQGLSLHISARCNIDLSILQPYVSDTGTALCEVVYRHIRDDKMLDIWISRSPLPIMYGGSPTEEDFDRDYMRELLERQNEIRKSYYGFPPRRVASTVAVGE